MAANILLPSADLLHNGCPSAACAHPFKATQRCLSRRVHLQRVSQQNSRMTCAADTEKGHRHPALKLVSVPAISAAAQTLTSMPALASQDTHATVSPASQALGELAELDGKSAGLIARVLSPFLSVAILLMIVRIVLSWYPQIDGGKLPWSVAVKPTEPVLAPTRKAIPPVGGVDVSPIVWVAVLSFLNEILLGPQGILSLLQRKVDVL